MSRIAYQYSIVRYSHDSVTGESLNVGVIVFSSRDRRIEVRWPTSFMRVQLAYPGTRPASLRHALNGIETALRRTLEAHNDVMSLDDLLKDAVSEDLSGLHASPAGVGFATSVESALTDLLKRFVLRWESWSADFTSHEEEAFWKDLTLQPRIAVSSSNDDDFHSLDDEEQPPLRAVRR